jgi:hypothetical protein
MKIDFQSKGHVMPALVSACIGVLSMCGCRAQQTGTTMSDAVSLTSPTTVGTAPMFAVSPSGLQAVAWVSAPNGGSDGRLYVSVGSAAPVEIRDSLGPIEPHGESPPKISFGPDGSLDALYSVVKLAPGQRFPLSALRFVKSVDGGKNWSVPVTVTDQAVWGSHSFHALHIAADGAVYASWLGKTDRPSNSAEASPPKTPAVEAKMQGHAEHEASASWIARSDDGGASWTSPIRVDSGEACPCCRTSVVSSKDGTLYMSWRHVFPGSIRDVVVAQSHDRGVTWSNPVRVHVDNWKFDACPHAGPALAIDSSGTLHIAWWTGKEGSAGVYYARSTDGATTFSSPVPLGIAQFSRPAHVQLALAPGHRVVVAWDDGTKQVPEVILRVSKDGGAQFGEPSVMSASGRAATFPVLGVAGDSIAIAWSEESAASEAKEESAMKDKTAPQHLRSVGEAQVLVRKGRLL